jgi:hypothetical protein
LKIEEKESSFPGRRTNRKKHVPLPKVVFEV